MTVTFSTSYSIVLLAAYVKRGFSFVAITCFPLSVQVNVVRPAKVGIKESIFCMQLPAVVQQRKEELTTLSHSGALVVSPMGLFLQLGLETPTQLLRVPTVHLTS